mmetsp:Transcript_3125/g.7948  ORF Transcript_3125/g.7948 Transcript_3125/m.7948 type:complete len:91 (-) Transcript_3125:599-871(-)
MLAGAACSDVHDAGGTRGRLPWRELIGCTSCRATTKQPQPDDGRDDRPDNEDDAAALAADDDATARRTARVAALFAAGATGSRPRVVLTL